MIRIVTDFSPEMMYIKRQQDIFKILLKKKEKNKTSVYNSALKDVCGKNKSQRYSERKKNRVFGTSRPVLPKALRGVLLTTEK